MITANLRAAALMTGSMALFSIADAIVKAVTRELPVGQILLTFGVLGTVALLIAAWLRREAVWVGAFWSAGMVTRNLAEMVAAIAFVCSLAYNSLSMVAPFRYSRLVFGIALGMAFFGERPDIWMMVGATLVIASGLYALMR